MSFSMVGKRLLFTRCMKSLTCHRMHILNEEVPGDMVLCLVFTTTTLPAKQAGRDCSLGFEDMKRRG